MINQFLDTTATLAAINQPGKPLVVINASDTTAAEVFSFTPDTLDDLCLSFNDIPVAAAVSASAAVPVAFSPVLLKNRAWSGWEGNRRPAGDWRTPLRADGGAYANIEAFRTARYWASLRADRLAYREEPYVRLLDGGRADNLRLTAARRVLMDPHSPAYVYSALGEGRLRRLVVISVNARSDARNDIDQSAARTTIAEMVSAVTSVPIDATTANVAASFRGFIENLMNGRERSRRAGKTVDFKIYPVEIDFDELPTNSPAEVADRDNVKSISTSWTITPEDVTLIDKVAGVLLWRHPCLNGLLDDLRASGEREAVAPTTVQCPQQ